MTISNTAGRSAGAPGDAGSTVAEKLYAAEAAVDVAVAETAALLALLPIARTELWLSAVSGQRAFEDAAASVGALTQARGHLVATHRTLAVLARRIGLDDLAVGPLDKPDDTPPIGDGPKAPHAHAGPLPPPLRSRKG